MGRYDGEITPMQAYLIERLESVRGEYSSLAQEAAEALIRKSTTGEPRMKKIWFVVNDTYSDTGAPMFLYESHAQSWAAEHGGTVRSKWLEWQ